VVLIGGAMAYTFLQAIGRGVGESLVEEEMLDQAELLIDAAAASTTELMLPRDHVAGKEIEPRTSVEVFADEIEAGWMGLDIGPETAGWYTDRVRHARTVLWNGPVGVYEIEPFDVGTRQIAEACAAATEQGAVTVLGGGDTAAAIKHFGLSDQVSHVSTGGGASLELLEGKKFRSVELLDDE
jgi:3-phosphoglycerate kinase